MGSKDPIHLHIDRERIKAINLATTRIPVNMKSFFSEHFPCVLKFVFHIWWVWKLGFIVISESLHSVLWVLIFPPPFYKPCHRSWVLLALVYLSLQSFSLKYPLVNKCFVNITLKLTNSLEVTLSNPGEGIGISSRVSLRVLLITHAVSCF